MNEVKDKEERKLKKVKIALMRNPKYVMWSGIMMVGSTKVVDNIPTAMTNGRDELYGRNLIKELSEKELAFVVLHENLHKAFHHMTLWRKLWEQDPRLTNMACDYVINLMLVESDPNEQFIAMAMRDGKTRWFLDKRFAGMNAKQVFDILKQEKQEKQEGGGGGGGGGEGVDEHDWEGAKDMTEQEKQELTKEIDRALRQGQIAAGKLAGKNAGGMDRAIGEILKPKIDWREVLREFMTSVCANKDTSSWRRVNRRFIGHDIYMPSLIGETVGRIVVGVDTSGSIGGAILDRFLSEVHAIASEVKPEGVDLLYWDTEVAGHEVYDVGNMDGLVRSTKPKGGGGTDPSCVTPYLKNKQIKPECIIMLTDGYIGDDWGQYDVPVLWVVVGSNNVSPVGKTINVEEM
jgi:predicted metal-dependent peptidase